MTEEIMLAWAAGFIDGEGCVSILTDRKNYACLIDVGQVNKHPLTILAGLFGGTVRHCPSKYGGHWAWRVYGPKASIAAQRLLPYLIGKKRQAEILIEFQDTKLTSGAYVSPAVYEHRETLYKEIKSLHPRRTSNPERLNERASA